MTIAIERRPADTSAFTYLDEARPGWAEEEAASVGALSPVRVEPSWKERIDDLLRMYTLDDDWDGAGSAAPASALIGGAIQLARGLEAKTCPPAHRVSVTVDATISFEWQFPGSHEEVEVTSPVDGEWRRVKKGVNQAEIAAIRIG